MFVIITSNPVEFTLNLWESIRFSKILNHFQENPIDLCCGHGVRDVDAVRVKL